MQRALALATDAGRARLANELRGHVCEATESPHGNFVIQRLVELMRPAAVCFVLDELISCVAAPALARHRYGCRVIERIIEHFPPRMVASLVDDMLCDAQALCKHAYGNFVMQHLLEHGESGRRLLITHVLSADLESMALDKHGGAVLDKALTFGPIEEQRRLADLVLRDRGLLAEMILLRSGFAAARRLILVVHADTQLLTKARSELASAEIQRSKHGRRLAALPDIPPKPDAQDAIQEITTRGAGGLCLGSERRRRGVARRRCRHKEN